MHLSTLTSDRPQGRKTLHTDQRQNNPVALPNTCSGAYQVALGCKGASSGKHGGERADGTGRGRVTNQAASGE